MEIDGLVTLLQNFLLVALRTGCLMFFWPVWDYRTVPRQIKVFSLFVIALALTPAVSPLLPAFPATGPAAVSLALREVLLGLGVGVIIRAIFAGVQMAGNLAALYMGFSMVTLFDPQTREQNTIIADFLMLAALLLFLALEVHHALFRLLAHSFVDLPLGDARALPFQASQMLVGLGSLAFRLAVSLMAPVLSVLFFLQLTLGFLSRAVPQIQIMILSFPLTIALGLLFFSLTLLSVGVNLQEQFSSLKTPLQQWLKAWQG
jgi:flagellar biosynthetic protein FliR